MSEEKKKKEPTCETCPHVWVRNAGLGEGMCTFFPKWERISGRLEAHYCSQHPDR